MHAWCCLTNSATVREIMVLIVCAHECVVLGRSVGFGSAPDSDRSRTAATETLKFSWPYSAVTVGGMQPDVGNDDISIT